MDEQNYRLFHKDLITLLPDDLLIYQINDLISVAEHLMWTGLSGNIATSRVIQYPIEHLYTYFQFVYREAIKRKLQQNVNIDEYREFFMAHLTKYASVDSFMEVDYEYLYQGWMSPRYLQQCILVLEELYDNEQIELKDYFRLINGVKNLNKLCEETLEALFC